MITENLEALLRKIAVCAKVNDEAGGSKAHKQVVAMFKAALTAPVNPVAPAIPLGGLTGVPCAVGMDKNERFYGWLFAPHVDGQWVTAAKLDHFSMAMIEHWMAAQSEAGK